MKIESERVALLVLLAVFGIAMAGLGNYLMDSHQPVQRESQLLENFLIMQAMAGKNTTPSNLTYVVGGTGLVVSFNDILTDSSGRIPRSARPANTT